MANGQAIAQALGNINTIMQAEQAQDVAQQMDDNSQQQPQPQDTSAANSAAPAQDSAQPQQASAPAQNAPVQPSFWQSAANLAVKILNKPGTTADSVEQAQGAPFTSSQMPAITQQQLDTDQAAISSSSPAMEQGFNNQNTASPSSALSDAANNPASGMNWGNVGLLLSGKMPSDIPAPGTLQHIQQAQYSPQQAAQDSFAAQQAGLASQTALERQQAQQMAQQKQQAAQTIAHLQENAQKSPNSLDYVSPQTLAEQTQALNQDTADLQKKQQTQTLNQQNQTASAEALAQKETQVPQLQSQIDALISQYNNPNQSSTQRAQLAQQIGDLRTSIAAINHPELTAFRTGGMNSIPQAANIASTLYNTVSKTVQDTDKPTYMIPMMPNWQDNPDALKAEAAHPNFATAGAIGMQALPTIASLGTYAPEAFAAGAATAIPRMMGGAITGAAMGAASTPLANQIENERNNNYSGLTFNPAAADWTGAADNALYGGAAAGLLSALPGRQLLSNKEAPQVPLNDPNFPVKPLPSSLSAEQVKVVKNMLNNPADPNWADKAAAVTARQMRDLYNWQDNYAGSDPVKQQIVQDMRGMEGSGGVGATQNAANAIIKGANQRLNAAHRVTTQAEQSLRGAQRNNMDAATIDNLRQQYTQAMSNEQNLRNIYGSSDFANEVNNLQKAQSDYYANQEKYYNPFGQYGQNAGADRGKVPASAVYKNAAAPDVSGLPYQHNVWRQGATISDAVNNGDPTAVLNSGQPNQSAGPNNKPGSLSPAEGQQLAETLLTGVNENGNPLPGNQNQPASAINIGDIKTGNTGGGNNRTPEEMNRQGKIAYENAQRLATSGGAGVTPDLSKTMWGDQYNLRQAQAANTYLDDVSKGINKQEGYKPPADLPSQLKTLIDNHVNNVSSNLAERIGNGLSGAQKLTKPVAEIGSAIGAASGLIGGNIILPGIGGAIGNPLGAGIGALAGLFPKIIGKGGEALRDFARKDASDLEKRQAIYNEGRQKGIIGKDSISPGVKRGINTTARASIAGAQAAGQGAQNMATQQKEQAAAQGGGNNNAANNDNNQSAPITSSGNLTAGGQFGGNSAPASGGGDLWSNVLGALGGMAAGALAGKMGSSFNPLTQAQAQEMSDRYNIPYATALNMASSPQQENNLTQQMALYANSMSPAANQAIQNTNQQITGLKLANHSILTTKAYADALAGKYSNLGGKFNFFADTLNPPKPGDKNADMVTVNLPDANGKIVPTKMTAYTAQQNLRNQMNIVVQQIANAYVSMGDTTDAARLMTQASHPEAFATPEQFNVWANQLQEDLQQKANAVYEQGQAAARLPVAGYGGGARLAQQTGAFLNPQL